MLVNVVGIDCPDQTENEFDKWYNETLIPHVFKYKGMKSVRRYKMAGISRADRWGVDKQHYPKFLAIYEFESPAAFKEYQDSPEFAFAKKDTPQIMERTGAKVAWVVQYKNTKSWQK